MVSEHSARYDFLVFYPTAIQVSLYLLKLESWREIGVILLFHLMATAMELFKTSTEIDSWSYPEDSFLHIAILARIGICDLALPETAEFQL